MRVAVLGPGGVGGLVAGALDRAGTPVTVIAREPTAELIAARGLRVRSVLLGEWVAHPAAGARLEQEVDALIVATKATGLQAALERVGPAPREGVGSKAWEGVGPAAWKRVGPAAQERAGPEAWEGVGHEAWEGVGPEAWEKAGREPPGHRFSPPRLVLPLLNGLDHLAALRARFGEETVVAGTIRVEADRPQPGVVVHSSRFLRIDMASAHASAQVGMRTLADTLNAAGIPARVERSESRVMWGKLVRLNALACTTSAYDKLLGEILATPELRADLEGAIEEGCAVAAAEGAAIPAADPLGELTAAHPTLGSSMQRDIAAGRPPELDAIPGAVLRAAARHGIECLTIERLVGLIAERLGGDGVNHLGL